MLATARFVRRTIAAELAKSVVRSVVGSLVVGAVFFGPNGVDPKDIVHHLRGSAMVALVVAALATLWLAPSVRRALLAPGSDILRALPYHRGVLGGALLFGVLAAASPLVVLVVAGGGPGVAFGFAIVALVAAVQPRVSIPKRLGGIALALGSVVASFRAPIPAALVSAPFGAWALSGAFRDAHASRGAPFRLVFGRPSALAVPWAALVQGSRADVSALLRALALLGGAALLARTASARFADATSPAIVAALFAAALSAPALASAWAGSARTLRSLPGAGQARPGALALRAAGLFAVVPFWAFLISTASLAAAFASAATFFGVTAVLAIDPELGENANADERLPALVAVAVALGGGALFLAPWAPPVVLFAVTFVRAWRGRKRS